MKRIVKVSLISAIALALMLMVLPAPAAARGFRGAVFVGGGWGWGWGPGWYYPYWGAYPYGYYYGPPSGNVEIKSANKTDTVYVDGGYVGTVAETHKIPLRPGEHNIAVQAPNGQQLYNQRVDVLNHKTTKIHLPS